MSSLYELNKNESILWDWLIDEEKPEDAVIDTIECNEEEIMSKLVGYTHVITNADVEAEALEARAEAMQKKVDEVKNHAKSIRNKIDRMKDLAGQAMTNMGKEKFERDGVKISMRAYGGGSVAITSPELIEERFLVPQPAKVDKKAIMAAMKEAGVTELPGATLVAPEKKFTFKL